MALKRKLTKAEYESINDIIKKEYVADGDDFCLDLDGGDAEDNSALKRAKDRANERAKEAEAREKVLESRLSEIEGLDARKRGDVATLEKSYNGKLETQKAEYEKRLGVLTKHTTATMIDKEAMAIASRISNSPNLLFPHIKARLQADFEGDAPRTWVLDEEGNRSAYTMQDLEKQFVANKDYAAIMIASKASGGAGASATKSSGARFTSNNEKPRDLASMKPEQLAQHFKEVRESKESQ